MEECGASGFDFIAYQPKGKQRDDVRSRIRSHAMKATSASRRRQNQADVKLPTEGPGIDMHHCLYHPIPTFALEVTKIGEYGLDPIDLSALTSIHLGIRASTILRTESTLSNLLVCRQQSYFSFIPSRVGQTEALHNAFQCLRTVAHSTLAPSRKTSDDLIMKDYGKALRSLQCAIDDEMNRYTAETLCAIGLLAIFEVLNPTTGHMWSRHISGASQLIQARGPSGFNSEFDKSLITALVYPICIEALFTSQECFLDNPEWIRVLESAVITQDTFSDRSRLGVTLMTFITRIPALALMTFQLLSADTCLQTDELQAGVTKLRSLRSAIIAWRRSFNTALLNAADVCLTANDETGKRYELLAIAIVLHILTTRMLLCISPNEREFLEEEVQSHAAELKEIQVSVAGKHGRAAFLISQKAMTADATIATHSDFKESVGTGRLVESWKLAKFLELAKKKEV
uniref:Transcription factor domain-containing protein n=1 Tax=Bionectria ochroleuca TaxID=29856 RepID=A0A8H7TMA4_BIOOC